MAKLTRVFADKLSLRNIPELIRQKIMGIIFLIIAAFIWLVFARTTTADMQTLFVMTPGGSVSNLPDLTFNSLFALNFLALLCGILGIYQLIKGFGNNTNQPCKQRSLSRLQRQ